MGERSSEMLRGRGRMANLLFLLVLACGASPIIGTQTEDTEPHKLALLVGIDQYRYEGIPDLEGSVNDVTLMKHLLVDQFGFPDDPAHIRVLTNGRATRQRILDSIEQHLIAQATRDSIIVFHFSGHGSQVADLPGEEDEADRMDETLLPVDSGRKPNPNRDIRDDELHSLLTRLSAKAAHVTVVLDSCHSGTATRSGGRPRSVPADQRTVERDYRTRQATGTSPGKRDAGWPKDGAYTLIAGAADDEKAYEMVEGSRTYGALTWYLVQAIRNSGREATYGEVMETVKARVTARFTSQNPQLEGSGPQALVFGEPSRREREAIAVMEVAGGELELEAGQAHGVTRGSIYELFEVSSNEGASSARPMARVEVDDVGLTRASLRLVSGSLPDGTLRAYEKVRRPAERKVRVFLDGTTSSPILRELSKILVAFAHLELVEDPQSYDLRLFHQGGQVLTEGATPGEISPRVSAAAPDAIEQLRQQVLGWGRWMQVLAIESRHASLEVDFEIEVQRTRGAADLALRKADLVMAPGDRFTLRVRNRSAQPVYFTLLDLTSTGSIHLVHPRPKGTEGSPPIASGKAWEVTLEARLTDDVESVRDVLKLIATSQPTDLSFLTRPPGGELDLHRVLGRTAGEVERVLAQAAFGIPRGPGTAQVEPQPWVTLERILEIRRSKP